MLIQGTALQSLRMDDGESTQTLRDLKDNCITVRIGDSDEELDISDASVMEMQRLLGQHDVSLSFSWKLDTAANKSVDVMIKNKKWSRRVEIGLHSSLYFVAEVVIGENNIERAANGFYTFTNSPNQSRPTTGGNWVSTAISSATRSRAAY